MGETVDHFVPRLLCNIRSKMESASWCRFVVSDCTGFMLTKLEVIVKCLITMWMTGFG